ncbi:aminotransferase class V-fold PLP-dependent enzyme [Clostridium sporogenes]|uniref:cysteine desulfurase n=2 Tax=Clostridium TaxID=1485 RepID=A0A6M0SW60_CLOBO|nr:aminotransferase class V-fold PLP-dependent enzyme [Clostridium sporogenes]NFA59185.1 aminotransferase class V-fold PLP-dependent enzyme [Clostridium botulinum]MDS1003692.1 aminotransferase class V-fold PLP-dependent enzyme [Clostridium sporogenes]NFI74792.1 aminotransferase class V-fold PLP-dependent enzyme [Clostridium sporogenes]NFL71075.1 aminotransferase class V-fold PLP-dependent enzyme [Clostridium sporogenes]NFM24919.1 aminotransferase class V-fold PLP-dependent enzyme [Clostridium 
MKNVYLDNAATSFPKAPDVGESMLNYTKNIGCNINRGVYTSSLTAENMVFETRELICSLFNFSKPENVVFTKNITESLNLLIKGLLQKGEHVIVSSMEHNAVMRPLTSLTKNGIEISKVSCDIFGQLNINDVIKEIKSNTRAIIMTNASNVCGTILPLEEVGKLCRENNLILIIDAAQTAGFLDIDFEKIGADALAFTGHKGLLGPQGIGGFLIKDSLIPKVHPFIEGGTGSLSEYEIQPSYMPDKYESGTINIPGIYGLNASLKYIRKTSLSSIREKELFLTKLFIENALNLDDTRLVGLNTINNRTSVVSLDFNKIDNAIVSLDLSNEYNIMTRCGLHCAPSAHKTLNTFPQGTVRFSFGHFNTKEDITYTIDALNKIIKKYK